MKAIQLSEYVSGPHELRVTTLPTPTPSSKQYLIRIEAAAANFFDLLQIRGKYQHQPPFPFISGSEFAGRIISTPTASKSPKFSPGDLVFGASQGAYATHILAPEASLRLVPKRWTCEEAAGLMVTAPTSYAGLVTRAGIKAGDFVLIHAAAGGVGLAAVQIAKAFGATVIATAGTEAKLQIAKDFGADYGINYKDNKNWFNQVKKLTPGQKGVDIVYDPVGMIGPSMKCAAWNARLLVIGFAGGEIEKLALNRVLLKNVSVVGLHWGMYAKMEPETMEVVWDGLYKLMEEGKFKSTGFNGREFKGLKKVGEALIALGGRETWGKVIVKVEDEDSEKSKL
ncbi:MAG: hypothetical protein M1834_002356 [Cirrosporium novae-zelandiae]|nr:MAG: hypothetical protein M1834_002356 [Cirrosporium novae-zelandiae]